MFRRKPLKTLASFIVLSSLIRLTCGAKKSPKIILLNTDFYSHLHDDQHNSAHQDLNENDELESFVWMATKAISEQPEEEVSSKCPHHEMTFMVGPEMVAKHEQQNGGHSNFQTMAAGHDVEQVPLNKKTVYGKLTEQFEEANSLWNNFDGNHLNSAMAAKGPDLGPKQQQLQVDSNWLNMMNYFPSGRKELRKQNLIDRFSLKSVKQVLDQRATPTEPNSGPKSPGPPQVLTRVHALSVQNKEQMNELDQQQELTKYKEPISMYMMSDDNLRALHKDSEDVLLITASRPKSIDDIKQSASTGELADSFGEATAERARNSLLKAAEVARTLSVVNTTTRPMEPTNGLSRPSSDRAAGTPIGQPVSPFATGAINSDRASRGGDKLAPKFLGFGQLQRIEPFNGNGRTQARLSCQFGLTENILPKNMTISDVEWVKFVGQYGFNERGLAMTGQAPSFDQCPFERDANCQMTRIKNDIHTTVHPRPAIQNYINTTIPSYSITLHEVDEDHFGLYRCSARRFETRANGTMELVFRLIPFEF